MTEVVKENRYVIATRFVFSIILNHSHICSLIAIMLGTLRMDIDTCIDKYLNMALEIFLIKNILSGSQFGVFIKAIMDTL
jgi:hypothetical protein